MTSRSRSCSRYFYFNNHKPLPSHLHQFTLTPTLTLIYLKPYYDQGPWLTMTMTMTVAVAVTVMILPNVAVVSGWYNKISMSMSLSMVTVTCCCTAWSEKNLHHWLPSESQQWLASVKVFMPISDCTIGSGLCCCLSWKPTYVCHMMHACMHACLHAVVFHWNQWKIL